MGPVTRSHRYLVALLLAFVTSVVHATPSVARCVDEAEDCWPVVAAGDDADDCTGDCCDDERSGDREDACGDVCTGCFCCPVRTAVTAPELPRPPPAEAFEELTPPRAEPVLASAGRDIFQPPRA